MPAQGMFGNVRQGTVAYVRHASFPPGMARQAAVFDSPGSAAAVARRAWSLGAVKEYEATQGPVTHVLVCDLAGDRAAFEVFAVQQRRADAAPKLHAAGFTRPVAAWRASDSHRQHGLPSRIQTRSVRRARDADLTNAIMMTDLQPGDAWALLSELLDDGSALHLYSEATVRQLFGTQASPFTRAKCAPELDAAPVKK